MESYLDRFATYFAREVAQKAARPLSNGAEMEFRVGKGSDEQVFTFAKSGGKAAVRKGSADDPQIVFTLTPKAADSILNDTSDEIGQIGVNIAKLIVSPEADRKVGLKLQSGFLGLFSKGYFGVITAGGAEFASFLAQRGLGGMNAIKEALKKAKSGS